MSRRRKKKPSPPLRLPDGALPWRLAPRFADIPLVFADASRLTHGGLGLTLYAHDAAPADTRQQRVALAASHALELQAAVFGLREGALRFPGQGFALFSDNRDAVDRLAAAKALGLASDPALDALFAGTDLAGLLAQAGSINWVQGHARCRGNLLADQAARAAAGETAPAVPAVSS